MKLRYLRITNFRSFKAKQTFAFPEAAGLYFMWGDNQAEPRLEGNAAGKSTIWKALTWLFFGKTSEGLKAGDACNWDAGKGISVQLEFWTEAGGIQFMERTWGPNAWTLKDLFGNVHDLAKDPSNPVMDQLRLEFEPFLASVLMAQGRGMFLDLKAEAKAALFAQVMGLDEWLKHSATASDRAKATDTEIRRLESRTSEMRGRLASAKAVDVAGQKAEWESGREQRLKSLETEYAGLIRRQDDLKARLKEREEAAALGQVRHRQALEQVEDAQDALDRLKKKPATGKNSCPTCGHAISDHIHDQVGRVSALSRAAKAALADWDDLQAACRSVQRDIESVDKALDNLESRHAHVAAEANPFARMEKDNGLRIDDMEIELKASVQRLDALNAQHSLQSSWVRWFKEIRLGLIGEALEQLEIEVNSSVAALGLLEWELRFTLDRETAAGTLQRGFTVEVISPHNPKPVPWEAWSGGEGQRLRIAANMGLANLIRARTGTRLNLEVWDEPTQFMSGQGVADLLDSLKQRAITEDRQVWIVDHRTLGYSGFTGSVGVIKTASGSHFAQKAPYSSEHERDSPEPEADDRAPPTVARRAPQSRGQRR